MAIISLKWFGGMAPRRGEQHLPAPHATEAENVNLYSGELRPLKKPALAHKFCRPSDECWNAPLTDDPSYPPTLPPGPGDPGGGGGPCIQIEILDSTKVVLAEIGGEANFFVTINDDASSPVLYQWFENNELMPGETSSTMTITVTVENSESSFTAKIENPCGVAVTLPATIDVDVPIECLPYDCAALSSYMGDVVGGGAWDLLDANTEPAIPAFFEPIGVNDTGADGLVGTLGAGGDWDQIVFLHRADLTVEDADLCEGPYCLGVRYNGASGTQDSLQLQASSRPKWGGVIPNGAVAVVMRGADLGPSNVNRNFLWRGAFRIRLWGQTSTDSIGMEFNAAIDRNVAGTVDRVRFSQAKAWAWTATFPLGLLTGPEPVLVQVTSSVSNLHFVPSSYQGYFYASYDMMGTVNYAVSVTTRDGTVYSDGTTFLQLLTQTFDWTHGDANTRPIADAFRPWDDGSIDVNLYMSTGFEAMYNLAVRHGTAFGTNNVVTGGGPIGVNTDWELAFPRNFSDYVVPPECIVT